MNATHVDHPEKSISVSFPADYAERVDTRRESEIGGAGGTRRLVRRGAGGHK